MAKPRKVDYIDLYGKYERGEITPTEIAKKYGISRTSFLNAYKREKALVTPEIKDTIKNLNNGLSGLRESTIDLRNKEAELANLEGVERTRAERALAMNKQALQNGLELIERNHGVLAQAAISIVGKSLRKASNLLDIIETPSEYNQVMGGFKAAVDSVGLFPKTPLVAVQNNVGVNTNRKEIKKEIEIKLNFLQGEPKNN